MIRRGVVSYMININVYAPCTWHMARRTMCKREINFDCSNVYKHCCLAGDDGKGKHVHTRARKAIEIAHRKIHRKPDPQAHACVYAYKFRVVLLVVYCQYYSTACSAYMALHTSGHFQNDGHY